jgi:hypothetical protein
MRRTSYTYDDSFDGRFQSLPRNPNQVDLLFGSWF